MESLVGAFDSVNVELYKKSAESRGTENFMVSPASILYACALTYGGARGATKENLEDALHFKKVFNGDVSKALAAFGQLTAGLNVQEAKKAEKKSEGPSEEYFPQLDDQGRPVLDEQGNPVMIMMIHQEAPKMVRIGPAPSEPLQLNLANGIFIKTQLELSDGYKKSTSDTLKAAVEKKDFVGDPSGATVEINAWVEDHTNGKIRDLIPPNVINESTQAVLANAIYFKAHWENKFDTRSTTDQPFYRLDGKSNQVQMMSQTVYPNYAEAHDLSVQFIDLPYYLKEASMLILLPKEKNGLPKLEAALNAGSFRQLLHRAKGKNPEVYLSLPKFKLDTNFDLKELLKNIGITTIFEPSADLTGILSNQEHIMVSEAFHKTFIEVNEEGTEAAAASAMIDITTCSLGEKPKPIPFIADHPFLYAIRHNATGLILFMGRVVDT